MTAPMPNLTSFAVDRCETAAPASAPRWETFNAAPFEWLTDSDVADWTPLHPGYVVTDEDEAYAKRLCRDTAEAWDRLSAAVTRAAINLRRAPGGYDDALADELEAARDAYMPAFVATPEAGESAEVDPLAHVKVGDPDPTTGDGDCPAFVEDGYGYWCTREAGHPGQHIAGTAADVVAVWGGETS